MSTNFGSPDKWLMFDADTGEGLGGVDSSLGCIRALDRFWSEYDAKGKVVVNRRWIAVELDEQTPITALKKGLKTPFLAIRDEGVDESQIEAVFCLPKEDPSLVRAGGIEAVELLLRVRVLASVPG